MGHSPYVYVKFTFVEFLPILRMEKELISRSEKMLFPLLFWMNLTVMNCIVQLLFVKSAHAAIRFHRDVIKVILDIASIDAAKLCLDSGSMDTIWAKSKDEIVELIDCRPYRNIFNSSSLKSITKFMNDTSGISKATEMNKICT